MTIRLLQATPELRRFADDELLRAPMLIEQVVDQTLANLGRGGANGAEQAAASQLVQVLLVKRPMLVAAFVDSLRAQVDAELAGKPRPVALRRGNGPLALLDEDEVAADVEVSHTVEAIRSIAEHELLEIQAYTAALAADMEVASDHNPFRPDACARALWDAAQSLPVARGQHVAFMRQASHPLAQMLRRSWAAACSRLEAEGVEPALYRTVIMPDGSRRQPPSDTATFVPELSQIRISLPPEHGPGSALPLVGVSEIMQLRDASQPSGGGSAADQVLLDLMGRLFDVILSSPSIPGDVRLLISRSQGPAIRTALAEPETLNDYAHPVWRFVDELAHLGTTLPPAGHADRARHLRLAEGLVERLVSERAARRDAFEWALGRLGAIEAHRLQQRTEAVSADIDALQALEHRLADASSPPSTFAGALDLGQLDTVPSPLMDSAATPNADSDDDDPEAWLDSLQPGQWIQAYLQGRRVRAMTLWIGERRDLWLLADSASSENWAMRRRALATLRSAGLAGSLRVRSQVRRAARKLLKQIAPGGA